MGLRGAEWDARTPLALREFNTSICICPTQGHSLQVTFPLLPGGLPARGCWASRPAHRGPSALPYGPQPLPCLPSRTQARLPDSGFRRLESLPVPFGGSSASTHRAPINVPSFPPDAPFPRLPRRVQPGAPGRRSCPPFPPPSPRMPTWRGPRPRSFSSASGRLPSPPGPAPLPGGYSLKPLRISLARSSLADMMRRPPPVALSRWPGGASQTVPRN